MLITAHTLLSGVLFWSAWCRLVKTTASHTRKPIRLGFVLAATASLTIGVAPWANSIWPWFPEYDVHPATVLMLLSFAAVQVSTAMHWRYGVPKSFTKDAP